MIGIIGAMDVEVDALKSLLCDTSVQNISGVDFMSGTLFDYELVIARCGIGKVNAAICAQTMILKYAPDTIINVGVGGSLSDELNIGDIALADFVVQGDVDTTALGDPIGFISTINIIKIPTAKRVTDALIKAANALSLHTVCGVVATNDSFIANSEKKAELAKTFGAIACEMEGGSIGQVCYVNNVDFSVVRAISDKADGSSHMDYGEFCSLAAKNSAALICEYIKSL